MLRPAKPQNPAYLPRMRDRHLSCRLPFCCVCCELRTIAPPTVLRAQQEPAVVVPPALGVPDHRINGIDAGHRSGPTGVECVGSYHLPGPEEEAGIKSLSRLPHSKGPVRSYAEWSALHKLHSGHASVRCPKEVEETVSCPFARMTSGGY